MDVGRAAELHIVDQMRREDARIGQAERPVVLRAVLVPVNVVSRGSVVVLAVVEGPAQQILLVEGVVDASQILLLVEGPAAREAVVQEGIVVVRLRPERHQRLADRVDQRRRHLVVEDPLPGEGVHELDRLVRIGIDRLTDVAHALLGGRGETHAGCAGLLLAEALSREEEEGLVLPDRPADGAAELVEQVAGLARARAVGEVREGVERLVSVVLVERAVELVGSGLGHDVDDGAARAAVLGREHVGFDPELLDGVESGRRHELPLLAGGAGCAVDVVAVVLRAGAVESDRESLRFDGSPLGVARLGARDERRQRDELAAVERKVLDLDAVDDFAEGRRLGLDALGKVADDDRVRQLADLEPQVDAQELAYSQGHALDVDSLESAELRLDFVGARGQKVDPEIAQLVAHRRAAHAGRRVSRRDAGSRHHGARAVGHGADNCSLVCRLCPCSGARKKRGEDRQDETASH